MSDSLVLFDIDGTLLRGAGPHHKRALIEGIRRVTGLETTLDGIDTAGMLDRDLITAMLTAAYSSMTDDLTSIMQGCQDAYLADCAADLSPFLCRGVVPLLQRLQNAGAPLGLVSGNLSAIGWKKLELAGIRSFFSVAAFAEDGHTRAELARIAAARACEAGTINATTCISLIGDHANDIAAAKANGFRSIAVASGVTPYEELAALQPDIVVRHLEELNFLNLL
jgi:phosphoglycolate phosphatase-like HAD superfamily hydrolase